MGAPNDRSGDGPLLTPHWKRLKAHPERHRFYKPIGIRYPETPRFRICYPGRRSGKTEYAKRILSRAVCDPQGRVDGRYFAAAPTHTQAKKIFWSDLKRLIPKWLQIDVSEGELIIFLANGVEVHVGGMDKPERWEGVPWDGGLFDEYANMKADVWSAHMRPALSTKGRPGWALFLGVPEGRNHYWDLVQKAEDDPLWDNYHWTSEEILHPDEIAQAKRDMDELTYEQEYRGSFVDFAGRAYYPFTREVHAREQLEYDPQRDLIFCFDFNVDPGIAVVLQEHVYRGSNGLVATDGHTAVLGEVHITRNSTTEAVCRRLAKDWGHHEGHVLCYGDATGGARGAAAVRGSNWDLIKQSLRPVFGPRLKFRVPKANPPERVRVNSLNSRLRAMDGIVRLLVDPKRCPYLVRDLEGVILLEGGSGELDKNYDKRLTHLTDALGYYVVRRWPLAKQLTVRAAI